VKPLPRFSGVVALLRAAILAWLMLAAMPVSATTYTVTASKDSWIDSTSTTTNHGTDNTLRVSPTNTAVIGFTMPSIPSNETITSAVLKLSVNTTDTHSVTVNKITAAWTETGVTWANISGSISGTAEASFTPSTATVSITITSLVQGWQAGTIANNGLALVGSASSSSRFNSRENGTPANSPTLVITTALIQPALTIVKSSSVVSDPTNGSTNPKAIPGAKMRYTINASNSSAGTADSGSTQFTDAVPASMKLYVGDAGAAGSGPVIFTDGSTSSGLTYTYTSLASATDSISFSKDGGSTYTYTPVPDANGYDANVTNVRIIFGGTFAGKTGTGTPSMSLQMLMQVK
jgi:hypothetical protein